MKLSKIYHFLGSVYFAILLIGLVAIFVIVGTLIESSTQSHRYAARLTYSSPLFIALLWGFFVNILFSALRRWPFKVKHIPFLVTHFGLLMILGGALTKVYFGLQGSMGIMEGAASQQISQGDTYVVQVEKRGEKPLSFNVDAFDNTGIAKKEGFSLQLLKYQPHTMERLATWIKGKHAFIQGLAPLPVHEIFENNEEDEIPLSGRARFQNQNSPTYELYALRIDDINQIVKSLYQQNTLLKISDRMSGSTLASIALKSALEQPISLRDAQGSYGEASAHLNLEFSDITGFERNANITVKVKNERNGTGYETKVPLIGDGAILNVNTTTPHLGNSPINVDIIRVPMLVLVEDQHNDTYMIGFDARGQVWSQSFGNNHIQSYVAYEEGYGGYAIQCEFPFSENICGREQREAAMDEYISSQIKQAISAQTPLSPPLQLLMEACHQAKVDFVETFLTFLRRWDNQHSWIFADDPNLPELVEKSLKYINWHNLPLEACSWTVRLFDQIEPDLKRGSSLLNVLQERQWPLFAECEKQWKQNSHSSAKQASCLMSLLTQQIFSASEHLPKEDSFDIIITSSQLNARYLSAYLRAYDIHLSTISPLLTEVEMRELIQKHNKADNNNELNHTPLILETPLVAVLETVPVSKKLEDNIPAITLRVQEGNRSQTITLGYDRFAAGLKWPVLEGKYLLRFQPHFLDIPYSVRLRQARQINYANSKQALSYESDIVVTDLRSGESEEKTISMNQVHETWDGYRFYLSNINPADESSVKRIQLVVNHDPAKYWLTYPGAIILSLGIILLFLMRPYQKKKEKDVDVEKKK